jgi:hypothetical protein
MLPKVQSKVEPKESYIKNTFRKIICENNTFNAEGIDEWLPACRGPRIENRVEFLGGIRNNVGPEVQGGVIEWRKCQKGLAPRLKITIDGIWLLGICNFKRIPLS